MLPACKVHIMLILFFACWACASAATVDIPDVGKLNGGESQSFFTKRTIYEFKGIPFAEPPTENLRFMPPVKKGFLTELNAMSHGHVCMQMSMMRTTPRNLFTRDDEWDEAEDCLFLDVYTPNIDNKTRLPVMFYIHGGSFIEGSSRTVDPGFLLEHDMVLVATQYRLGPLGFMRLDGDVNVTGNAALHDQLMALEWVRDNIEHFGGDPDRITLSGVSAGAASAALLYLSPRSEGLIHRVMLFSGSALAPWAIDQDPVKHSYEISTLAGCANETVEERLDCLQQVDVAQLFQAFGIYTSIERLQGRQGMGGTTPVIDNDIILEMPEDTMKKDFASVPMLMSIVKHEGLFLSTMLNVFLLAPLNITDEYDAQKYDVADILLGYSELKDTTYTIRSAIRETYFDKETLGRVKSVMPGIIDFLGAANFKGPALHMAELNAERNETYLAAFSYYTQESLDNGGVDHGSDMKFLLPKGEYTVEEENVAKKLTGAYASFIINGTPIRDGNNVYGLDTWSPYSKTEKNYLHIDNNFKMMQDFEQEFIIHKQRNSAVSKLPRYDILLALLGIFKMLY